jgi:MFS family permease
VIAAPVAPRAGVIQGGLALLVACLPLVAFMSLPPAMPKLLAHFASVPGAALLVPLIATAPSACIALFSPVAGLLADKIGRRRIVLGSIAIFTASGLTPLFVDSLPLILASRLITGVANAALLTVGTTLIADYFEGAARRRWLAFNGVAGSLLITLAMLAGGLLADWSWRGPFLIPLVGLPVLALCYRFLFEPVCAADQPSAMDEPTTFSWSPLKTLAAVTLICAIWFYAEAVQIGLVLDKIGVKSGAVIAVVSSLASIGYPLGAVVYSRICGRWSQRALQILGWGLIGAGLVGVGLSEDSSIVGLTAFVQQVGGGVLLTMLIHQCQERFAFRHRARSMGVWASAFFAGQFASPLVVAALAAAAGGLRPAMALMGALSLCFAVVAARLVRLPAAKSAPVDLGSPATTAS